MGGGGGILSPITDTLFGSPETVATPNFSGAAEQTAAANLAAARAALAANRVNQVTPFGNLNYTQSGTDSYGNPMWTATQSIAPDLQAAVDKAKGTVSGYDFSQFKPTGLPSIGINPGETMTDSVMRRLQPQIAMEQKQFDAQMANQGIPVGSEAYTNARRVFDAGQNDRITSAVIQGTNTGLTANQQQYAQQQGTYTTNLNAPFTYASNVKGFASPSYVNPAQQATTAGADYMGAMGLANQNDIANANAANARANATMGGLFSLGGAGIMKYG
jgi:hypothetical protein